MAITLEPGTCQSAVVTTILCFEHFKKNGKEKNDEIVTEWNY